MRTSESSNVEARLNRGSFGLDLIDDLTLPRAIISMAERECLNIHANRSQILGGLCPIQWLLQRARGDRLAFDQALALETMLLGFRGNGKPLDAIVEQTIVILQTTHPKVAQFICEWMDIEG